jgi:hypothetical protein
MKAMLSRRPSASMVVAVIALFVATGGVGYAAATIDSGDIIDNTIRSRDVLQRNLQGVDVKQNSLGGTVIKESSLGKVPSAGSADTAQHATNAQDAVNAQNSVNAQNATNAQNAAAVGPNGVGPAALENNSVTGPKIGSVVVRAETIQVGGGESEFDTAGCESGEQLLSGGAFWSGNTEADAANLHIVFSYPTTSSWTARGYNNTGGDRTLTIRALCLTD